MNPELLLAHFNRVSDAPNAVPYLRRFILNLAVRGKLTGAYDVNEQTKPLGSLATFIMGQAPPGTACNETGKGTLFVKAGEFGKEYPEHRAWTTQPLKFAKNGDVLICVVGATVGKLNFGIDCAIGRSVAAIRPQPELDTRYLYFSLMPFTLSLRENARGSAQGVIGKTDLALIPIWFPPLAEQHRIVTRVEELMALCDQLEASQVEREHRREFLTAASLYHLDKGEDEEIFREHASFYLNHLPCLTTRPDQISQLRQTILNLAVRGMLVKQDEGFSAIHLLEAVKSERLGLSGEKGDLAKAASEFDNLAREQRNAGILNAYITARCACHFITKGTTPAHEKLLQAGDVPFLKVYNIVNNKLDFNYKPTFISRTVHDNELKRSKVRPGDVLMNIVGPPLGKVALVTDQYPEWNVNQAIAIFRPVSLFDSRFIMIVLSSSMTIAEVLKETRGVVGQDNLSLEQVRSLRIPLLPIPHQRRIVARVDELMAVCDKLETQLTKVQGESSRLLEAVLHRALAVTA